jgi:IS30 family transposase
VIDAKLRLDSSPEQVPGWLQRLYAIHISHEWIYQRMLADKHMGGNLYCHFRCHKKRRKRYGSYDRWGKLPNRFSIEERPEIVAQRLWICDWEVHTLLRKGHRQAIDTLTERRSGLALLRKADQRSADQVSNAVIELLPPVMDRLHTLIADNGNEFVEHERISQVLQTDFFFTHPFSAWERGANENIIGLI